VEGLGRHKCNLGLGLHVMQCSTITCQHRHQVRERVHWQALLAVMAVV
jgi:hypothetical protein